MERIMLTEEERQALMGIRVARCEMTSCAHELAL